MSQHAMTLNNQAGAAFRADLNNALLALVGQSSGAAAPTVTFAYQFWADTTTGLLKMRNAANTGWITLGTMASTYLGAEQSANKDASGGYPGLTGQMVNIWNTAKSFMVKLATSATGNWTHYLPNRNGTLLDDTDYTALTTGSAVDNTARSTASTANSVNNAAKGVADGLAGLNSAGFLQPWHFGTSSFGVNGYQIFASGLILQWGKVTISSNGPVTFPIGFPNAVVNIQVTGEAVGANPFGVTNSFTLSGFSLVSNTSTPYVFDWYAVGY